MSHPDPTKTYEDDTKEDESVKCPFCGRKKTSEEIICPCEVAPKYDQDYEEWKNK